MWSGSWPAPGPTTVEARFMAGSPPETASGYGSVPDQFYRAGLLAGERRRAFLREGHDRLPEVPGAGALLLQDGLQVQQLGEAGVGAGVDGALDRRVGAGRTGRQPRGELAGRGLKCLVVDDPVDHSPLQRLLGADALAEIGH